jgi:hypothetical protein
METEQEIADRKWARYINEREKYGLTYTAHDAYMRGYDDGRSSKNINLQIADWLVEVSTTYKGDPGTEHLAELAKTIYVFARALSDKGEEGRDAILTFQKLKYEQEQKLKAARERSKEE